MTDYMHLYIYMPTILHSPFVSSFTYIFVTDFSNGYDGPITIDPNSIDYAAYVSQTLFHSHGYIIRFNIWRGTPTHVVRDCRADSDALLR